MNFGGFQRRSFLAPPPDRRSPGWRKRSAVLLLALVLAGFGAYSWLTREARLIAIAGGYLEGLSGGQIEIARMHFSFFGGIHLVNVTLRTPPDLDFGPDHSPARVVFQVADLHLEHRPLSLLLGRFEVRRITALRPQFQIVHRKDTGLSNWQAMLALRPPPKAGPQQQWPIFHLRDCVLRSGTLDGSQVRFADPMEVELLALPADGQGGVYTCTFQPLGPDRLARTLKVDVYNGRISGDLPGVWISQLQPSLPAQYSRWCDILELTGQVGAESIELDARQSGKCTINLVQVSLSVPMDESEFFGVEARARRLVRLKDVTGRIVFEPDRVGLDISGRLNGAPCRVWGEVIGYAGPLHEMGYDLHIDASRIVVPDRRDPYVADQVTRLPASVRKFFRLFDPTAGWIGVAGHLTRPPGADQPAKFRGTVTVHEGFGCYDEFPYHGEHAEAVIRLTDEGILFDVWARRDPASFHIKGWVKDGSRESDADVHVRGVSIPLDGELLQSLPWKVKRLWKHFDFYGQMDCDFHIWRTGGTKQTGPAPWHWRTKLTLHEVAARYRPFNYMQWGLNGVVEAAEGVIHRIDLHAVEQGSLLRITGTADLRENQTAVDVRVRAYDRPLMPDMLPALPAAAQQAIAEAGVAGRFDVDARLHMSPATEGRLECRAAIDWKTGRLCLRQAPYPFEDMKGSLFVDLPAERIDIREITGRHGDAQLRVSGTVETGSSPAVRLRLELDDLALEDRLFACLPPTVQQWWRELKPEGSIDVRSDLELTGAAGSAELSHQTQLRFRDNRVCWESFPLPLEQVAGSVLLSRGRCEVQDLSAVHEGGQMNLSGRIDWIDGSTTADVRIAARKVPLNEPLRQAVPWQLRKIWNDWQPAGRVDVDIDNLRYRKTPEGATWDFAGGVNAELSKLAMSVDITDGVIRATGTAHIDEARNTFSGQGKLQAERAVASLIPISHASADWCKRSDGAIRIDNFRGESLGGTVAGFFEIVPTLQGDQYGVVLALDRGDPEQLAAVLTNGQMSGLSGTLAMQLRLRGLIDQPDTRTGSAEAKLVGQNLYRLPVLLQLANVLNIPVPSEAPQQNAQEITARLTLMANTAILDSLELHDQSFIMRGVGTVDMPTRNADLTVIAARPRIWPAVPVINELLEGTVRELVEVHGTGPLSDLKFEARTLRSVQAALQVLSTRRPRPAPKITRPAESTWNTRQ